MGLDSYLEIFTTMYGWYFSSVIVQTLLDTGLVALPFVFMLIKAWMEAHEEGAERGGVQMMIRKLEIQIWTSLFVYVMCVVSSSVTSLSGVSLYYAPTRTTVNPNPQPGTMSNNESSYSQVFGAGAPSNVSVPAWWYTVMGLSSGFNAAVRAGINRGVSDLRVIEDTARSATITDPFLRNEVKRFRDECFTPARSRLLRSEAQTPSLPKAKQISTGWVAWHTERIHRSMPTSTRLAMCQASPTPISPMSLCRQDTRSRSGGGRPASNGGKRRTLVCVQSWSPRLALPTDSRQRSPVSSRRAARMRSMTS